MSTDGALSDLPSVWVWGLPLAPLTFEQTLDRVEQLIRSGRPNYFITANLHYAMLAHQDRRLRRVNEEAAFLVADGMPLVWASRRLPNPLPARVAGADLVPALCERAAQKGYRVFLLGGAAGVAEEVARVFSPASPHSRSSGPGALPSENCRRRSSPGCWNASARRGPTCSLSLSDSPRANCGWPKTARRWAFPRASRSAGRWISWRAASAGRLHSCSGWASNGLTASTASQRAWRPAT